MKNIAEALLLKDIQDVELEILRRRTLVELNEATDPETLKKEIKQLENRIWEITYPPFDFFKFIVGG